MIPKIIHYCWFGGAPKPKSVLKCIASWRKHCPDFEIREWSEKDFDLNQNEYTRQAYETKVWGFVPDYLRLWIIYHYGGIYLDTDVQIIKNLSPLLKNSAYAGFESQKHVALGLGFGAEPGNPFILEHMKQYDTLQFINEDGSLNKTASPRYTTKLLLEKGLKQNYDKIQKLPDITIYPTEYFCPKSFHTGLTKITKNTYSVHLFDASWFDEDRQAEKIKRWRTQKKEAFIYNIRYFPNRMLRKFFGNRAIDAMKAFLKKK